MWDDIHYFPHICDLIVRFSSPSTLPALRQVSPLFAEHVDRRLLEHVVYGVREGQLSSAVLPGEPLLEVRPEHIHVLDLAMSIRFADRPPFAPPPPLGHPDDPYGLDTLEAPDSLETALGGIVGGMTGSVSSAAGAVGSGVGAGRLSAPTGSIGGTSLNGASVAGLAPSDELWTGNAKAPWVLADPPSAAGSEYIALPDALPHLPRLRALRCLNYQPVVFPHILRYTAVPVVIYPAQRAISWSPSRAAGGRIVGGGVRAPRAIIAFTRPPKGDFSFYFRANQHERLDIVLVPGDWGRWLGADGFSVASVAIAAASCSEADASATSETASAHLATGTGGANGTTGSLNGTSTSGSAGDGDVGPRNPLRGPPLVDRVTSGTFWMCLTDEVAHHVENGGRCTIVGLESWDAITRRTAPGWDGSWADLMVRDVAVDEIGLGDLGDQAGLEYPEEASTDAQGQGQDQEREGPQKSTSDDRLRFTTFEDWRRADENVELWDLIC